MRIDASSATRSITQFISGFRSTALPCRVVYVFLLIGLVLVVLGNNVNSMSGLFESFTVVPFRLLPPNFWMWTLGTFWFIETNIGLLICHFVCVHVSGIVLSPLWGWREWTRYFALANIASALATVAASSIVYMLTNWEWWYFYLPTEQYSIRGLSGFDGAILVAVKQALPDTVIFNTPWFGRYKNSHFPFTATIIGVVVTALRLLSPVYFLQFVFGTYAGWIYLRFYQKHPNAGFPRGDPSDNFAFSSFFPSIIQPPIDTVSSVCYRIAVRLKLCKPSVRRFVDIGGVGGTFQGVVSVPTMSTNQADAERRRQKALKDLNERLAKSKESSHGTLAWPSLIDEDDDTEQDPLVPVTHGSHVGEVPVTEDQISVSSVSVEPLVASASSKTEDQPDSQAS